MDETVLREVLEEVGNGSMRFNETNYYSPPFPEEEGNDAGNVVEDFKRLGGEGTSGSKDANSGGEEGSKDVVCDGDETSTRSELGDCVYETGNAASEDGGPQRFLWSQNSEELEELGRNIAKGMSKAEISFEELCPLASDSQWCSSLKGKDVKTLTIGDFDNITFPTEAEAEKFFYYYAFMIGFSVKKFRRERKYVAGEDRTVTWRRTWACSKEGRCNSKKGVKVKEGVLTKMVLDECTEHVEESDSPNVFEKKWKRKVVPRGTKYSRTCCKANFTVKYDELTRQYHVFRFETVHNHGLAEVSERHFLRSFREVTAEDVLEVEALVAAGVSVSGSFDFLARQSGGAPFVGFILKDLYNKLDCCRKMGTELGDAEAALNWFRIKGTEDPNFYCRYTRDTEGKLATVFWRDSASFLDYEAFGDVLIIDSTYKTNIYGMPLVLFVGANNHRASVVFACALVCNEKKYTFDWLMETFVHSMNYHIPITVITDGDERLHKALRTHMKDARQRLCAWHIGRNIGQNVKNLEVQRVLGKLIYASYSTHEWQLIWDNMITAHGLSENEWMKSLHARRERWAEAFFRGHYCAGMCSTQRCEGMNNKVKTKVGRFTKLVEFVPRLHHSICRLRDRYLLDNFKSRNHLRKFELTMKGIEEQIFNIFTDDIYLVIRGQMVFENDFVVSSRIDYDDSNNLTNYVTQYGVEDKCWIVTYVAGTEPDADSYTCSCGLFESDGIPCCHIFSVFKKEGVKNFPKSLICKRWTKDAGKKSILANHFTDNGLGESHACRYAGLIGLAKRLCYNMSVTEEGFEKGMDDLNTLLGKYSGVRAVKKARVNLGDSDNVVQDPVVARTKGSHGHKPEGNGAGTKPDGKGPSCGHCHKPGHNRRSCPQLKKGDGCKGAAPTVSFKSVTISEQRGQSESGQWCDSNAEEVNMNYVNPPPSRMPPRPMFASGTVLRFDVGREYCDGEFVDMNSQVGE